MCQACLLQSPEQAAVDRRNVCRVFRVALMLVDAGSPLGTVNDEDRYFLLLDQFAS